MVYELPAAKRSIDQNLFKFKLPPGAEKALDEERWKAQDPAGYEAFLQAKEVAAKAEADALKRFAKTAPQVTYKIPKLQYIRPKLAEDLEGQHRIKIVRRLLDEYVPGLFARIEDPDQLLALFKAWAEESGLSVGESSGSNGSSESTEEPSDEISSQ